MRPSDYVWRSKPLPYERTRMRRLRIAAILGGFLVLSSAHAYAEEYTPSPLTAAEILQRAKDARGTLRPGRYVEVDRTVGGGIEETSTTYMDGDDFVTRSKWGPFQSAFGRYHGQRWEQDANGSVILASGFHATEDPNVKALSNIESLDSGVKVLGVTIGSQRDYVIEVKPKRGVDEYRYYDASTFLVDKVVTFDNDRHKHNVTHADYRRVFGMMASFKDTSSDGRPENDLVTTTLSMLPDAVADVPMTIPVAHNLFAFTESKPYVAPARFTREGIVVRIAVGVRKLDFLLDTGSTDIVIDPGVAHQLGLPRYGKSNVTIGGDVDFSETLVPDLTLGPLHGKDVAFAVLPVNIEVDDRKENREIVGLLGFDFLSTSVVAIDFKKETVTFYPPGTLKSSDLTGARALHVDLDDGVPRAAASFAGIDGKFLIDTGAFATILSAGYASRLPESGAMLGREIGAEFIGGHVDMKPASYSHFLFGGVQFDSAVVLIPKNSTSDERGYDGILGRDVLSNYVLYLDYRDGAIALKPNF